MHPTTSTRPSIAIALMASLLLSGCNKAADVKDGQAIDRPVKPAPQLAALPSDPNERAATCYAAHIAAIPTEAKGIPADRANEAAQILLLAGSTSGVIEPSKVNQLKQVAQVAISAVRKTGQAPALVQACRAAYPATASIFAGLGADDRDQRLQCFTLANAMTDIYDQSPQVQGPSIVKARTLSSTLDERLTEELLVGGRGSPAELAGLATRALAVILDKGPITQALDACAARYARVT